MGGKETLRVLIAKGEDVSDSLLSRGDGGQKLDSGLKELVHERYHGKFIIRTIEDTCGLSDFNHSSSRCCIFTEESDVVALSLLPEMGRPLRQGEVAIDAGDFKQNLLRLIREIKERVGAHIIVYNCSSFDPEDQTSNYREVEDTLSLRAHRFDLALMEISALEGISIIDVDRLIAELGGESHVVKALNYSSEACRAICQEFLRVLEDIGFFEDRLLVPQLGQRRE